MPKAEENKSFKGNSKHEKEFIPQNKKSFKENGFKRGKHKQFIDLPQKNDPSFYTKYKSLSESVAKVAFNHRNGSDVQITVNTNNTINGNIDPITVVDYIPVPGYSDTLKSGINVAANAAYKVLNRKYRGSMTSRYESADLGIAQFAILDFYLSLAQVERAYGIAQVAKVNQRQIPRELLIALGFDADDFMDNLANTRAAINYLITRAQSLCLVKGYSLLDHHLFLLSNVFKDKDTLRGQYFAYRKFGYWKWNPTKFATGSALEWVPFSNPSSRLKITFGTPDVYLPLLKVVDVMAKLDDQLTALLGDSDIDAICSDILAYFGNDDNSPDLVKLRLLPEAYGVEAIYDKDALLQFHNTVVPNAITKSKGLSTSLFDSDIEYLNNPINANVIPSGGSINDFNGLYIYQIDNTIISSFESSAGGSWNLYSGIYRKTQGSKSPTRLVQESLMDTDELTPSVDQVMEWSRNIVLNKELAHTNDAQTYRYTYFYSAIGTVLPTLITTFEFRKVGNNTRDAAGYMVYTPSEMMINELGTANAAVPNNAAIFKYDWAPIIFSNGNVYADLDNYIVVDEKLLRPIHEVAVLSEFHNPVSDVIIKDE